MTIGTLMSCDICYHGCETASRRISGFYGSSKIDKNLARNLANL